MLPAARAPAEGPDVREAWARVRERHASNPEGWRIRGQDDPRDHLPPEADRKHFTERRRAAWTRDLPPIAPTSLAQVRELDALFSFAKEEADRAINAGGSGHAPSKRLDELYAVLYERLRAQAHGPEERRAAGTQRLIDTLSWLMLLNIPPDHLEAAFNSADWRDRGATVAGSYSGYSMVFGFANAVAASMYGANIGGGNVDPDHAPYKPGTVGLVTSTIIALGGRMIARVNRICGTGHGFWRKPMMFDDKTGAPTPSLRTGLGFGMATLDFFPFFATLSVVVHHMAHPARADTPQEAAERAAQSQTLRLFTGFAATTGAAIFRNLTPAITQLGARLVGRTPEDALAYDYPWVDPANPALMAGAIDQLHQEGSLRTLLGYGWGFITGLPRVLVPWLVEAMYPDPKRDGGPAPIPQWRQTVDDVVLFAGLMFVPLSTNAIASLATDPLVSGADSFGRPADTEHPRIAEYAALTWLICLWGVMVASVAQRSMDNRSIVMDARRVALPWQDGLRARGASMFIARGIVPDGDARLPPAAEVIGRRVAQAAAEREADRARHATGRPGTTWEVLEPEPPKKSGPRPPRGDDSAA